MQNFAIAVKGIRGRKWFRADSGQAADREFLQQLADDAYSADYLAEHGIKIAVLPVEEIPGDIAPIKYRPWAAAIEAEAGEEEDIDLDQLADADL